jgi:EAL domain-containing protein (putative c-di-GMP-specific phosphodiesterase class I)
MARQSGQVHAVLAAYRASLGARDGHKAARESLGESVVSQGAGTYMHTHLQSGQINRHARSTLAHPSGAWLASVQGRSSSIAAVKRLIEQHRSVSLCVVVFEASGIQRVAELLGRDAGEMVAGVVAERAHQASKVSRWIPLFLNRLGRDDFIGLFGAATSGPTTHDLPQAICQPIEAALLGAAGLLTVGCASSDPFQEIDLVACAQTALAVAQERGPGTAHRFDPMNSDWYDRRRKIEGLLAHSIEAHTGLSVSYQPVVSWPEDAGVGQPSLYALEALARWHSAELGRVSPAEFIPVAETTGLIAPLGRQILDVACRAFKAMQGNPGSPGLLSVNVSGAQLSHLGVVTDFIEIVRGAGLVPRQVQLEITESIAVRGRSARDLLAAFRTAGFRIALDDFGTGYSSLAYLNQLPIDTVKIDRSFVSEIGHSPYHRAIVEATIRLAGVLGVATTAEGVETPDQAEVLHALGCHHLQGALYSMPLTEPEMRMWLAGVARGGEIAKTTPSTDRKGQE